MTDSGQPGSLPAADRARLRSPASALSHSIAMPSVARQPPGETPAHRAQGMSAVAWLVQNFAGQDWLTVGYLSALIVALLFGKGYSREICIVRVSADLTVYLLVVALVRLQVLRWGSLASALLYRVTVVATLLASFFQLREILPAVSPRADDALIYGFDLRVFGVEPSVWLDQFVSPWTTEWFAFFYFLYFFILAVHVLPMVFWQRDLQLLARFATGVLLMFMTAHLLYMVVPGWGPYHYLEGEFHHPLRGGPFWKLVRETVDFGGAQKDIFPSLHTAVPTFLFLFSFRHRSLPVFRRSWPFVLFLATQIIIATMFLRWHYLVDVVAGLCLAAVSSILGHRIADWELGRRERLGVQHSWAPLVYPWLRKSSV